MKITGAEPGKPEKRQKPVLAFWPLSIRWLNQVHVGFYDDYLR